MTVPALDLVHLVWAPLGTAPFERFLDGYRRHQPGTAHRLVLVAKEFADRVPREAWEQLASDVDHEWIDMPDPALDLEAYRRVASASSAQIVCFTNSTAVPLEDGWLAALALAVSDPTVGMVGATGSWESTLSAAATWLKPLRLRHFSRFPNPHLRTNSFALERDLMLGLNWPRLDMDKLSALRLESGRSSLTRQIERRGLRVVVVGADGRSYEPTEWPLSRTFRSGDQENLLIGDNRTAQYEKADPLERRRLNRLAWGSLREGA